MQCRELVSLDCVVGGAALVFELQEENHANIRRSCKTMSTQTKTELTNGGGYSRYIEYVRVSIRLNFPAAENSSLYVQHGAFQLPRPQL